MQPHVLATPSSQHHVGAQSVVCHQNLSIKDPRLRCTLLFVQYFQQYQGQHVTIYTLIAPTPFFGRLGALYLGRLRYFKQTTIKNDGIYSYMYVGYITNTWQSTTVHHISSTKEQTSYRILYRRCLGQSFQDLQTKVVCLPLLTCKVRRSQQKVYEIKVSFS